ncbi:flagellar basal-body rod protein FlgG [candidate division KSB1 bacterium]
MSRVLRTAATGMMAQQMFVDIISNNLANVNTTGYKKNKIEFQDLMYQTIRAAGSSNLQGSFVPTELHVGSGTRPVSTQKIHTQGESVYTNNTFDLAINGAGFFQITKPNGQLNYTRDGAFKLNEQGVLVTSDGFQLEPQIAIPPEALSVDISRDGLVMARLPLQEELQQLGQIQVVTFINPAGLTAVGQNLFEATFAAGAPNLNVPGENGAGVMLQGQIESSNVDIVEEMVNMIVAQRAFETNSKAVQAADDMMNTSNNMRR